MLAASGGGEARLPGGGDDGGGSDDGGGDEDEGESDDDAEHAPLSLFIPRLVAASRRLGVARRLERFHLSWHADTQGQSMTNGTSVGGRARGDQEWRRTR